MGTNGLGLIHELLLYSSEQELVETAVPFLRAGFEADEPGLLSCSAGTAAMLRGQLADDPRLVCLNRRDIYATPAAAIAAYQQIVEECIGAGAERARLVAEVTGEPIRDRWLEWGRYEAVVNRAMQPYPVTAICAYDTRSTPPEMLASGPATHPYLVRGATHRPNPYYVDPSVYLRRTATLTRERLESDRPVLEILDLVDLDALRRRLEVALYRPTHDPEAAADFMLATHEVVTNAARHGRPPIDLRLWVGPDRLLCTVTDQGEGFDDPLAGYTWPASVEGPATSGMGLWLARRLCDRVDMFHTPQGFTVRLLTELGPAARRSSRHHRSS